MSPSAGPSANLSANLSVNLFANLQRFLPKRALSRFGGHVASNRLLAPFIIRNFIRVYGVDLRDAVRTEAGSYTDFNDFFTRALRPETRPIAPGGDTLTSPCDGTLGVHGRITAGRLIQAKGHSYALAELLADAAYAEHFRDGTFATIYLAPKDYHRVHWPLAGRLMRADYLRGRLFSVNSATEGSIPGLFARNERLVCRLLTPAGPLAVVLVGAFVVAGIRTVWGDPRSAGIGQSYPPERPPLNVAKGEELGHFYLGSTVIVCLPEHGHLHADLAVGATLKMGQAIGSFSAP